MEKKEMIAGRGFYYMPACACTFGASTLGNTISISLVYKKNHVSDEKAKELTHKVVSYLARSV